MLLLLNIFKHTCLTTFVVHYNPPLNTVKITVFKVIEFNENTELIPSGKSYDLYPDNNDPTDGIMLVLVGITLRNQLGWVEVYNGD